MIGSGWWSTGSLLLSFLNPTVVNDIVIVNFTKLLHKIHQDQDQDLQAPCCSTSSIQLLSPAPPPCSAEASTCCHFRYHYFHFFCFSCGSLYHQPVFIFIIDGNLINLSSLSLSLSGRHIKKSRQGHSWSSIRPQLKVIIIIIDIKGV